jgi:hypothetical protein
VSDEELFAADVASVREHGLDIIRSISALWLTETPEDAVTVNEHIAAVSRRLHESINRLDGWREWVRDKSVNESALLDQLAHRMHVNSLDASDPTNGELSP